MKQRGASLDRLGLAGLLLAALGCGGHAADGARIGGETNWLLSCNTDDDCTVGQCLCNVCTVECVSEADSCSAGPPGSGCAMGSELGESCADQLQGGICVGPATAGSGLPATEWPPAPAAGSSGVLDAMLETLAADLEAQPAADRPYLRYLSLANLREVSARDESLLVENLSDSEAIALNLARGLRAISKLANSLSQEFHTSTPISIDWEQLYYRIDLRKYGWNRGLSVEGVPFADGWEAIVGHASLAIAYQGPAADRLRALSGSEVPWLFADDFVATAAAGETYYALLGLPDNLADLEYRLLRQASPTASVRGTLNLAPGTYRAGSNLSGASYSPRAIERRMLDGDVGRGYWLAFDFESESRGSAVFENPLGFAPDATEVMFTLPNGLNGYFIADADGRRVSESPLSPVTVSDPAQRDGVLRNAASCFGCHNAGPIIISDEVRDLWNSPAPPSELADPAAVLRAYPGQFVLDRLMDVDAESYALALEAFGLTPNEPDGISRLFVDAGEPVGSVRAADELLVTPEFLRERLSSLPESIQALSVDAGSVPRPEFAAAYRDALCVLQEASANRPVGCP